MSPVQPPLLTLLSACRLSLLSSCLEWRHLAPTAPDTLATYPFHDCDPFIIDSTPHVIFAGNQPSFGTRMLTGAGCNVIAPPVRSCRVLELAGWRFRGLAVGARSRRPSLRVSLPFRLCHCRHHLCCCCCSWPLVRLTPGHACAFPPAHLPAVQGLRGKRCAWCASLASHPHPPLCCSTCAPWPATPSPLGRHWLGKRRPWNPKTAWSLCRPRMDGPPVFVCVPCRAMA